MTSTVARRAGPSDARSPGIGVQGRQAANRPEPRNPSNVPWPGTEPVKRNRFIELTGRGWVRVIWACWTTDTISDPVRHGRRPPLGAVSSPRRELKRRISDAIYRQLLEDAQRAAATDVGTDPGGDCRASRDSSAVDLPLRIDTLDQPLPGPAEKTRRRTG